MCEGLIQDLVPLGVDMKKNTKLFIWLFLFCGISLNINSCFADNINQEFNEIINEDFLLMKKENQKKTWIKKNGPILLLSLAVGIAGGVIPAVLIDKIKSKKNIKYNQELKKQIEKLDQNILSFKGDNNESLSLLRTDILNDLYMFVDNLYKMKDMQAGQQEMELDSDNLNAAEAISSDVSELISEENDDSVPTSQQTPVIIGEVEVSQSGWKNRLWNGATDFFDALR